MTLSHPPEFARSVQSESDVAEVTRQARRIGATVGFGSVDVSYLATAAAELAHNLVIHAGGGVFRISVTADRNGVELAATDTGPGIADIELALTDGYSTAGGLGCGLPGVKRLMDGLEIHSEAGTGTSVRAWKRNPGHGQR